MADVVAVVPFTVINAMTACGQNLADATVMATQIFMDDLETCKEISNGDIDDAFCYSRNVSKTYNGYVCLVYQTQTTL